MIIVTGATGQLGRGIVRQLLARTAADRVAVSVRDPEKAADLAAHGVSVRRGDFADPGTLASAFQDASQVLVISTDTLGEAGVIQARAAIDAAIRPAPAGFCTPAIRPPVRTPGSRRRVTTPPSRRIWPGSAGRIRRCATATT